MGERVRAIVFATEPSLRNFERARAAKKRIRASFDWNTIEARSRVSIFIPNTTPKAPILTNQAINLPARENIIHNIDSDGNIVNNIKNNKTKIRRKITPLSERIAYDITEDVLNRKADINSQTTKYTYADQINTVQNTPIGLVNPIVDNDTSEESDSDVSEKSDESDELLTESSDEESVTDLYILEDTYGETRKINHKKDIIYMENNPEVPDNYLIKLQSAIYLSPYSKTSFTIKPMNLSVSQMEETKFMLFITNDKLHDRDSTWQPASSYLKHNQDVLTIYLINNSDSTIELSAQEIIGELDVLNVDDIEEMECYRVRKPTEEDFFHIEEVHDPSQGTMIEYEEKLSNKIDLTNVPTKTKQAYPQHIFINDGTMLP
ncbi:hypothetical protein INT47_012827 [Mucor saturninus]|uniref:Uncharacterized protein n=1 Tax=Mucor saturninus TaxID=64648 RepID=A0A8H7UUJ6_9FUNG|nr:hypothetical protein INT47_012827 [Mucor saturninus]